jgi:hypothetical protein
MPWDFRKNLKLEQGDIKARMRGSVEGQQECG